MKIRVAYLKRDENRRVLSDGVELHDCFDNLDVLPRVGETVVLPEAMLKRIPGGNQLKRRYEVVSVDYHWDRLVAPLVSVYIADLFPPNPLSL